ncbi:pseudouridine synthase [Xylaria nigripes]|nr:pseudouridine synthase [Xylaria nigripes]
MWSLGATCRNWHPPRPHQLFPQLLITACIRTGITEQCHRCSFSTTPINIQENKLTPIRRKMDDSLSKYGRWTKDALIKRIQVLERKIEEKDPGGSSLIEAEEKPREKAKAKTKTKAEGESEAEDGPPRKKKKKYSTRVIALKLAYLGKNYGGFEYQASGKYPSIEEELWKALVKACLISPEDPDKVNFEPMEYSKCGRTDRGVSAFGQVIAIRVRSNRPLEQEERGDEAEIPDAEAEGEKPSKRQFDDMVDELPYARILNRLLPRDIRILAWCLTPPADFSARHHCRERQYRYFFTQPAYAPMPSSLEDPKLKRDGKQPKEGWLDIEAMRAAAKRFEGVHDFRNFCKIDPTKHLQSFERRIFESDIVEVPDIGTALPYISNPEFQHEPTSSDDVTTAVPRASFPKVYYFHVRGSAFLWHQIRCMVAVLFMVAQGLEDASVIDRLLDIEAEPRRPAYVLANETPLVLWDCLFPRDLDDPTRKDGMDWVYVGEDFALSAHSPTGLVDDMWDQWRERKMDELLTAQLLGRIATQADLSLRLNPNAPRYAPISQKLFEGGNRERSVGKHVPLLKKERLAAPEEAYDRDAKRRGFQSAAHKREVMAQYKADGEAEIKRAFGDRKE